MRSRCTVGLLLLPWLLGCPEPGEPNNDAETRRGTLVLGHEARSFTACDSEEPSWVVDATGGLLAEVYESLAHRPYQPVFVEIVGSIEPAPDEGFGAEYASQVTVHELSRAAREGPGCGEDTHRFGFRALGNEPFWSLTAGPGGLRLNRMSTPQVVEFPYNAPESRAGSRVYRSVRQMPRSEIQVELRSVPCVDSMSGAWFGLAATVRIDEEELRGCAYLGHQADGVPPGPTWKRNTVEFTSRGCDDPPGDGCIWFRFDWFEVLGGIEDPALQIVRDRIAAWMKRPLREGESPASLDELIIRWEDEYAWFRQEFPDSAQGRMVLRNAAALASPGSVVSLRLDEIAYTGGAHPNRRTEYVSLDATTGAQLSLADVVDAGQQAALTRIAETAFRRARGIAPGGSLTAAGFSFQDDRFVLNENFAVTTGGLVFHYDAYEIGSYASGPTTLELDSAEIRDLLRPEYRLR